MEKMYQLKLGKPFKVRDIDPLYYACDYMESSLSFLMDKEKFQIMYNKGIISEYRQVSSL